MKVFKLFLVGPMGAGKSTIGRYLAQELQLDFYDTDQEIEARTGADIAWIFDIEGEAGFRKREQQVVDELTQKSNIVLATGGGVVETPENRIALASRGTVIYLRTSVEQQLERTRGDTKRPLLQVKNADEKLKSLWQSREPYYKELADLVFDTDECAVKTVASEIIKYLQQQE